jgi:peptidoglycan/LPS O-acetylase OafA/YrhL
MASNNGTFLQSLGSLQLLAVIAVVLGHFWLDDSVFMNSVGVSFCFVYSGFFTAMRHPFSSDYGVRDHAHFMRGKLAKLYPLHMFAVALGLLAMWLSWGGAVGWKSLLAHATLTSSWIPIPAYYFGANPVAWFVCDLFFLYLMAPLVVKALRLMPVMWQAVLMLVLLVLEFVAGYRPDVDSSGLILSHFALYQFPPIRLLDFASGVVLFNITCTGAWQRLKERLTPRSATIAEVLSIVLFLILYRIGKDVIHAHCFRAYCASAPAIIVLLSTFVLTSSCQGAASRALSVKPMAWLSNVSSEVYLLQFGVYFLVEFLCKRCGLDEHLLPYFMVQMSCLAVAAWLTHRYYVAPLARRLFPSLAVK